MSLSSAPLDRRRLLMLGGGAAAAAVVGLGAFGTKRMADAALISNEDIAPPFTLGVASGDPTSDGVVLWTRLAPRPLEEGAGLPSRDINVEWQVAEDPQFSRVVRSGRERAAADQGHSLHVEVSGLSPASWYWYRFRVGQHISPVGRTRTAPSMNSATDRLAFAFASCQHFEHGFFTPQRHMADEPIDFVVFLGDYIYEGPSSTRTGNVRQHTSPRDAVTVDDYRRRYAQYKSDPDLQAAHAAFPWIITWDDHEVANDYSGEAAATSLALQQRQAAAYQAFYEHLPLRRASSPSGTNIRLFRRHTFGDLLNLNVLDTRQYRNRQECAPGWRPQCSQQFDPNRSILGNEQEQWLLDGMRRSQTRWNVIANSVLVTAASQLGPAERRNADTWDGYPASRKRLLDFLAQQRPSNPVIITGDIHVALASELKSDPENTRSPSVGTEFVCSSLTSDGDGSESSSFGSQVRSANPAIRYTNGQRGYVRCVLTPQRWRTDFRVVSAVSRRGAPVSTAQSFTIENGQPGFSST